MESKLEGTVIYLPFVDYNLDEENRMKGYRAGRHSGKRKPI